MNFLQHVQANTLQAFLNDDLPNPTRDVVGLHLSFCPICQEQQEEMLLNEANYEMSGGRSNVQDSAHIDLQVLYDFWKGAITDRNHLEELSAHCLVCEECRRKRYEVWFNDREHVRRRRYAAIAVSIIVGVAARARRSARWAIPAILVGVGTATLALLSVLTMGPAVLQNAFSSTVPLNSLPPVQIEDLQISAGTQNPSHEVFTEPKALNLPADRLSTGKRSKQRRPLPAATKNVGKLWEEIALLQRISLKDHPQDEDFRGAAEDRSKAKRRRPIVLSRTGETSIRIELPSESKNGKYVVSIRELDELDTALANDEPATSDGKELSVSLDLKDLAAGEYVLLVERETGEPEEREYVGYFPVFVFDPRQEIAE